jgi:hypothetical protein
MPADSDPTPASRPAFVTLPHTWRPLGVRLAGWFFGLMLLIVCVVMWISFPPEVREGVTWSQRLTLIGFGVLAAGLINALMRSRVIATEEQLVVVNGYRRREFTWAQVVSVTLPAGAPWATLDLADGTTVSAMGIQGSDGRRASTAVRELRALLNR